MCFELGADLCYTEMVSAEALTRSHPKTGMLMDRAENETRFAVQLFGSRPETLAAAAALAAERGPALIDLNCGCPVPKIVRAGAGSALMKDPALIRGIVAAMKAAVGPGGPVVTGEDPLGLGRGGRELPRGRRRGRRGGRVGGQPAREDPRPGLRREGRLGKDRRPRTRLAVPVFGSGDVSEAGDAARMIAQTGCAGVMIARGAMGDPFIFREARAAMEGRPAREVSAAERVDAARRHLFLAARFLGERTACVEFRKQFCSRTPKALREGRSCGRPE